MTSRVRVLLLAVVLLASGAYCYFFFDGYLGLADGNDYAGLARSIVRGEGFTLGHIYPLSLVFHDGVPQPDNLWAPAYPVYLSLWFALFGVADKTALIASVAVLWVLVLMTYMIAGKVAGDSIATLTAALVGMNQVVLNVAVDATPELLTASLLILSILPLLEVSSSRRVAISGLFFGLAVLSRYQIIVVAPVIATLFIGGRWKQLALWAAVCLLALAPWFVRNWLVFGNPLFTLQTYGEFTKAMGRFDDYYFTYRSFFPMTLWYALTHFPFDLFKKFAAGVLYFARLSPQQFNYLGMVPLVFALSALRKMEGMRRKIIYFTVISAAALICASSLDGHHLRHLVSLQPFLTLSMVLGFLCLVEEFELRKRKVLLVIAVCLLFVPARFPHQEAYFLESGRRVRNAKVAYRQISEVTDPGQVVVSDASDAVWWYADRPSIWIPVHYADLLKLLKLQRCDYIYLQEPMEYLMKLSDNDLAHFLQNAVPVSEFSGPGQLYRIVANSGAWARAI